MKILILGAERVGGCVAEGPVGERNHITVVDTDPARPHSLQDRLDLRGVVGNGVHPSVLSVFSARALPAKKGRCGAECVNSQFGEESTKVLVL